MKKTLTALALLTLLVTAISFGVARWSVRCSHDPTNREFERYNVAQARAESL